MSTEQFKIPPISSGNLQYWFLAEAVQKTKYASMDRCSHGMPVEVRVTASSGEVFISKIEYPFGEGKNQKGSPRFRWLIDQLQRTIYIKTQDGIFDYFSRVSDPRKGYY
jgi:hypothetical protein